MGGLCGVGGFLLDVSDSGLVQYYLHVKCCRQIDYLPFSKLTRVFPTPEMKDTLIKNNWG
jgi:hypothetical protein